MPGLRHACIRETVVKGIGQEAIRCANCGADAAPFKFANGYTIAFDNNRAVGVTMNRGSGREHRPRRQLLRRDAGKIDPELRADLLPRMIWWAGWPAAALHGPARHNAVHPHARLAQRRRFWIVPDWRAARIRHRGGAACRIVPTAIWTSTPCAPGPSSSARSRCPAAASTWATCTRCRATARLPVILRRVRHGDAASACDQGAEHRRAAALPGCRGSALSWRAR